MVRKKSIELVQEVDSPKALIINGGEVSAFLAKTLEERDCVVEKVEFYSPLQNKFDYVFLFDNQKIADEVYEKNLTHSGKFILLEIKDDISFPFKNKIKVFKIGDPSFWSMPELADKILRTLFSSSGGVVDLSRKPAVQTKIKEKIIVSKKEILPIIPKDPLPMKRDESHDTYPSVPILEKKPRFNFKKIFFAGFFIFLGIFLLFSSIGLWYFSSLQKIFTELENNLKSSNITAVSKNLKEAKKEIKNMQGVYGFATDLFFPLKNISYVQDIGILLETAEKTLLSGENFVSAAADLLPTRTGFDKMTDNLSKERFIVMERQLTDFTITMVDAKNTADKINLPYFPKDKINTLLSPIISRLTSAYDILPAAEKIFLSEGTKVYLVLLQNNMELRPTGGFIGSYGLLTITSGKIADFKIEDVYSADGQLKGHVEPPLPIRRYLAQPNFFLRDSNFDPDFAASAYLAASFLQKEMGKNVDGVIGVNLTLAQKLMQVVGPIRLADFSGEEITADNFFYKVHYFSRANFFPGSTQKKDILTAIVNEIIARFTSSKVNYPELISVLHQSAEEKNILFYFTDQIAQQLAEERGWAGRMTKIQCVERKIVSGRQQKLTSDSCLADYLAVSEANLGVNKANYSISKSTVIEKNISADGKISTTVTISYENQENTEITQSAIYTNYLRVFVPKESRLVSITLNNAPVNPTDIDTGLYGDDKTVFGLLVKIAPGNKGVVKINFLIPSLLSSATYNYQLFYQKQPGDKNSPLIFSLTYPQTIKLTPENFTSSTARDYEIYYTTDTSVDRVFALKRE